MKYNQLKGIKKMYRKGDFHIHSTESDGELKPGEIVLLAKERRVDIIALTDHNTVSGNKQAVNVGQIHGVKVIPGIELSTRFKGNKVHILGYFTDDKYQSDEFKFVLNNLSTRKFKACQIYFKGKLSFKSEGGKIATSAGIDFLHHYNAKVVLAHPTLLDRSVFEQIINLNFDGIEAKYYRNKDNETEYFINVAKKKNIIYTAGSDFHSLKKVDLKHGTLGQIYLENEEIDNFLNILNLS
ncbi:PHP domain-containing protein [Clostridium tertium]|jgi:3',5'-nucleoside bisphosphate phosphatase|uniref:PHP domain-containing protein n=2 Tax=Clostridium TaxID=1485 RepID=UPI0029007465|nr:PHP domain-containing protein [Clostridium sp.]MDU2155330.1 PHP domain-containing protein [Clostridium sp.]MDU3408802.1 PHP domain-containing protein [Clostridium sp.]